MSKNQRSAQRMRASHPPRHASSYYTLSKSKMCHLQRSRARTQSKRNEKHHQGSTGMASGVGGCTRTGALNRLGSSDHHREILVAATGSSQGPMEKLQMRTVLAQPSVCLDSSLGKMCSKTLCVALNRTFEAPWKVTKRFWTKVENNNRPPTL